MGLWDPESTTYREAWENRLPGEQWITLDSPEAAEIYLAAFEEDADIQIIREPFPNPKGLYARLRYPDRIPENKVIVPPNH